MRGTRRAVTALILAASLLASFAIPARAQAQPALVLTAAAGRTFTPNGDGVADRFEATLTLGTAATASAEVLTWEGVVIALPLAPTQLPAGDHALSWDGAGATDGPYRLRATATDAAGVTTVRELQIARVQALPYQTNPSAVVIFLDPGHGIGSHGGALARLPDGTLIMERDLNLDIGLKLAAMLRAAGVRVSLSRTTDAGPNSARLDRDGDRDVDGYDDFLARMDAANRIRADAFIAIHNNFIPPEQGPPGRTEAFYCGVGCPGAARSRELASAVLQAHVEALSVYQTAAWQLTIGSPKLRPDQRAPTDDYIRFLDADWPPGRHFYYLGQYTRIFRPRPVQMPAMLMESLALSQPTELAMLANPAIRTVIAAAYFNGIARWLAERTWSFRFDPAALPTTARVGQQSFVDVRLTNNGNVPIPAGTPILVGTVPPVRVYDGSQSPGRKIGGTRTREPIAPGASLVVRILVTPTAVGAAIWKVDAVLNGVRTSAQRVPFLQWRVNVGR